MKPKIKIQLATTPDGQFVASAKTRVADDDVTLRSEPFADKNAAVKHLIRLDPDVFEGGFDIEEAPDATS